MPLITPMPLMFHGTIDSISRSSYPAGYLRVRLTDEAGAELCIQMPADEARGLVVGDRLGATLGAVVDVEPAALEAGR